MIFLAVVWGDFGGKSYHDLTGNYMYFESPNLIPLKRSKQLQIHSSESKFHHRIFYRKDVGHPEKSQ